MAELFRRDGSGGYEYVGNSDDHLARVAELEQKLSKAEAESAEMKRLCDTATGVISILQVHGDSIQKIIVEQLQSYAKPGFMGSVDDPIYREAMRIESMGFELAHELRSCGHSRGDYRDPKYGTAEYAGDERCVACGELAALRKTIENFGSRLCLNHAATMSGDRLKRNDGKCEICLRDERETDLRKRLEEMGRPVSGHTLINNETLAGLYIKASGKKYHASDCATSCAPAETPGPCDCTLEAEEGSK